MAAGKQNPFDEFLDRYAPDAYLFVREVLNAEPDQYQKAILDAVSKKERHVAVRSGHGVGKTTTLAWLLTWHICTKFPQKAVCTAPTASQLFDALASETKSWIRKLPPSILDLLVIQTEQILLRAAPDESFIVFRTSRSETPEAMAGVHSANVLLIADEASGIPEPVFEAAAGSMSGENAVTVLAGNPVRSSGRFYDAFHKMSGDWKCFHISCEGHPRVSQDFVRDMAMQYGEASNAYRVRVLGEFPLADDDTVIPFELVEAAMMRDVEVDVATADRVWGVDVARFGRDLSALAKRHGRLLIEPVRTWGGLGTMALTGRIKHEWDETPPHERPREINIDVNGVGAGVCDRLQEMGLPAFGINVSESASLQDRYANLRSELWFRGRDWLNKRDCSLGGDTLLAGELVVPKYDFLSNGTMLVESKKAMRKRGEQSPNRADAFLLTFATDAVIASGSASRVSWDEPLHRSIPGWA